MRLTAEEETAIARSVRLLDLVGRFADAALGRMEATRLMPVASRHQFAATLLINEMTEVYDGRSRFERDAEVLRFVLERAASEQKDEGGGGMSVQIRGYERVRRIAAPGEEGYERAREMAASSEDAYVYLYVEPSFPATSDGFESAVYRSEGSVLMGYDGPCSSYGDWRAQLARLVGTTDKKVWAAARKGRPQPGPFAELINFSDQEGVVGPRVTEKLAADFAQWAEAASKVPDQWFRWTYEQMREAFELAARDGGVVMFS